MIFDKSGTRDYIFVSMLGVNLKNGKFRKLGICDELTIDHLIDLIEVYNTQIIIVDCSGITYKDDQKVFERLTDLPIIKDRQIVFFNIEIKLAERLIKDLKNNSFRYNEHKINDIYFSESDFNNILINIQIDEIELNIKKEIREFEIEHLQECGKEFAEGYQLKSTPLWTNYYVDIAHLFKVEPNISCWIISRMCSRLREKIDNDSTILLISTSLNGNILTSFIKEILNDSLKIEVICFDRLGPDLMINELNDHKNVKYSSVIHLCDFIIGGTEYKILKALLAVRKISISVIMSIGSNLEEEQTPDETPISSLLKMPEIFPSIKYGLTKNSVTSDS